MAEPARKVVVTGASGFVGQALVERLQAEGVNVAALSRKHGFDLLEDNIDLGGVDHVFHLAALTGVPAAWEAPVAFHLVNAHGVVRLLDQVRSAGCPMTYVSGYVYGTPTQLPIVETDPIRPNNPYAFSKYMGEEACRFFSSVYGMNVSIARPFNIYGPKQDERFIIPLIVNQVLDPSFSEVAVKDLTPKRDFIHIDDVVSALLIIASHGEGQTFNIGSGVSHSVEDIIQSVFAASELKKPVSCLEEKRFNEVMDVVADVTALRSIGWKQMIGFDAGIASVVAVMKKEARISEARPT